MKTIKTTFLFFLLSFSFGLSAETLLTESAVRDLMSNIQKSAQEKNVESLSSYVTEDVLITIEMPESIGGTLSFDKVQFKEMLKQGWAVSDKYAYDIKNINIKLSKDSKSATVTNLAIETAVINGQTISSETHQTLNVAISNGVPLIKRIHSKIELPTSATQTNSSNTEK